MGRALVVQYGCDAAACGLVVWAPVLGGDLATVSDLGPPGWAGVGDAWFCPEHAHLAHARRHVAERGAEG